MTITSAELVGRRIRSAREKRELTQAQLGKALSKTATAISYWESGQRSPGLDDLVELARILSVPVTELLPKEPPRVLARAQASALATGDVVSVVEEIVGRFEHEAPLSANMSITAMRPDAAARQALEAAHIAKPSVDVYAVAKACGVRHILFKTGDALSGLAVTLESGPVIAANADHPETRQRFSLAHELGHVLLSHPDDFHVDLDRPEGEPPNYDWRQERAANDFAAALLMPAHWLQDDLDKSSWTFDKLASRYKVSRQALGIRLSVLGLSDRIKDPW